MSFEYARLFGLPIPFDQVPTGKIIMAAKQGCFCKYLKTRKDRIRAWSRCNDHDWLKGSSGDISLGASILVTICEV